MRQILLQNATVIIKCDDFITKCGSSYKMRRLLQTVTVHTSKDELSARLVAGISIESVAILTNMWRKDQKVRSLVWSKYFHVDSGFWQLKQEEGLFR